MNATAAMIAGRVKGTAGNLGRNLLEMTGKQI
jgi:hypothetical protein